MPPLGWIELTPKGSNGKQQIVLEILTSFSISNSNWLLWAQMVTRVPVAHWENGCKITMGNWGLLSLRMMAPRSGRGKLSGHAIRIWYGWSVFWWTVFWSVQKPVSKCLAVNCVQFLLCVQCSVHFLYVACAAYCFDVNQHEMQTVHSHVLKVGDSSQIFQVTSHRGTGHCCWQKST